MCQSTQWRRHPPRGAGYDGVALRCKVSALALDLPDALLELNTPLVVCDFLSLGTTKANVAGAGLAESGIVLEVLRTSAGCAGQGRHRRARSGSLRPAIRKKGDVAEAAKSHLLLRAKDFCDAGKAFP
jgi:hypothetical protein